MIKLSKATEAPRSTIRVMFDMAEKYDDLIKFTAGEPDFATPQNVVDAAKKALDDGETHYTPNGGILPLRKAISKKLLRTNKVSYDPEKEIIVTSGGVEALVLAMISTLDPGDEVILPDPSYPNYLNQIIMLGSVPKFVQVFEEDSFMYRPEKLEEAITPKTRIIILNSPANPTGGVANLEKLEAIARVVMKHDILVLSDEVYRDLIYDNMEFFSICSLEGMRERTVIIDSFSKTYAMTGWRIGYAAGPEAVIGSMTRLQENVVSCVNSATQYAGLEALEGPQDSVKVMMDKYAERRDLVYNGINSIKNLSCKKPEGAFYAFVNISKTGLTSQDFAMRLLEEARVVVVPGTGFGKNGEGFVRIAYPTSNENIEEGLRRIKKFVESL